MLSSNSSSCNQNPNYTFFSENDINSFTTSKSDPNNFTFFPFPNSPNFEYEDVYLQFLDQVDLDAAADWNGGKIITNAAPSAADPIRGGNPSSGAAAAAGGRRMKKDRHSKINTARGPRDRRMRLSLDIARKFFDLQDLLRFDKASRTVDWLLRNSAAAIRELVRGRDGVLDCSSLIMTESNCTSEDFGEAATSSSATEVKTTAAAAASRRGKRGVGGGVSKQKRARVGKESRNKARDRARERTSQKKRLIRENNDGTVPDAAGTTTAAAGTTSTAAGITTHNFPLIYDAGNLGSDEAKITAAALCQFSFHETTNQFFHQGEQIAEINQFNNKTWEVYNGFNLSE